MTTAAQPAPEAAQRVDALRVQAKVLPGHRIQLTAPELPEGETVDVIVVIPKAAPAQADVAADPQPRHVLDILASLPPGPRLFKTPEEADRYLQQERDAWDKPR
jgi:hypothetical protein